MELTFERTDKGFEAIFESDTDVKIQLVFAEGLTSAAILFRSLDGEHWDVAGSSRDSNAPIIQTQGASEGDKFKLRVTYEPIEVICMEV